MKPGLFFLYFLLITVIFFIFLFTKTDFPQKLADILSGNIEKLQGQIDDLDEKIKRNEEKQQQDQYDKLKRKMGKIVRSGFVPVVFITFKDRNDVYQIIGYKTRVVFKKGFDAQKMFETDSQDFSYKTLDELYEAEDVDLVCLKRDWKEISTMKVLRVLEGSENI